MSAPIVTREDLEALRRAHHVSDDCWYSCPLSDEGCCDAKQTSCNCGADVHNSQLDAVIAKLFPAAG